MIERPLTEQVAALKAGILSPQELWQETQARIGELNPMLRAYLELKPEPRWAPAHLARPLAGVPVAIKANLAVSGLAHSAGIDALARNRATIDAEAVHRLRAAGATIAGTTNMAEGAMGAVSNNPHFGSARNPCDPSLTAGGSSGGSGAAVAAGMASASLGTDTMGSIRIPAAYCGVVGLKPSRGMIPTDGLIPLSDSLDTVGPMGRTVADVTLLFHILSGHKIPRCPAPRDIRIGVLEFPGMNVAPVIGDAVLAAVSLISDTGVHVGPVQLDLDLRRIRLAGLLDAEAGALEHLEGLISERPDGFSEGFRSMLAFAASRSAIDLVRAQRAMLRVAHHMDNVFESFDVLLGPTVASLPGRIGDPETATAADITAFVNAADLPALSMPVRAASPLPVGLQIIGPRRGDANLLALAGAIERVLATEAADQFSEK